MYDQSSKPFYLQSNFCPLGLSALAPGLYTYKESCNLTTSSNLKRLKQFSRLHIEPSVKGVLLICSNGSASLKNMAAMPIFGKILLKISLEQQASKVNLVIKHLEFKVYQFVQMINKKVREKSRECHNHKPQPFPDPKRKRKPHKSKQAQTEQTYEKH